MEPPLASPSLLHLAWAPGRILRGPAPSDGVTGRLDPALAVTGSEWHVVLLVLPVRWLPTCG
jgi:hypothetical protein